MDGIELGLELPLTRDTRRRLLRCRALVCAWGGLPGVAEPAGGE